MSQDVEFPNDNGVLWIPDIEQARENTRLLHVDRDNDVCYCYDSPSVCPDCQQPTDAYLVGIQEGIEQAQRDINSALGRQANVTIESRSKAAEFLYRKDAPYGEPKDSWERSPKSRKDIYLRSADMIAKLYNGWER